MFAGTSGLLVGHPSLIVTLRSRRLASDYVAHHVLHSTLWSGTFLNALISASAK